MVYIMHCILQKDIQCHIISCMQSYMHSHAESFDVFWLGGISGGDELREAFGD